MSSFYLFQQLEEEKKAQEKIELKVILFFSLHLLIFYQERFLKMFVETITKLVVEIR